jgi:hypothetical protein
MVALEDAVVPASVEEALFELPEAGVAVMLTVAPLGILVAVTTTAIGLGWLAGRTTSGDPWNDPVGLAGAATPRL